VMVAAVVGGVAHGFGGGPGGKYATPEEDEMGAETGARLFK
jgi:hypothetical protein